jgi:DNA-binding SARP family transcriptional activator
MKPTYAEGPGSLQVLVLGPIQIDGPHGSAVLTGARQRAVAGLLGVRAGTVLAQSRLVEALWADDPPRTAVKTLHSHIARVRQAIGDAGLPGVLVTRGPGYVLLVPSLAVDAQRFEEQVRLGRRELAGGDLPAGAARLSAALDLWRGNALEDAAPAGWAAAEAARLDEARTTALEDLWDARLRLGGHAAAVGELDRLLVSYPNRERLVGLMMVALDRSSRHTEALDAYRRVRDNLATELGLDPGPELSRLHAALLCGSVPDDAGFPLTGPAGGRPVPVGIRVDASMRAAPAPTGSPGPAAHPARGPAARGQPERGPDRPAQLPPRVGHFTGRTAELAALVELVDGGPADVRIAVISGCAGVGKTALCVQWAHQVIDRFPDGQLYLDLRGHEPETALDPSRALAHLLRALGVPDDRIPAEPAERAGLYRSLTYPRRILIVLDNAARTEDLLPLVPAGAGCLLAVTSRNHLAALTTHHAVHSVTLDALSAPESLALLRRVLGQARADQEPEALTRLAELCGRLPLALRIAAAKLIGTRRPVHDLTEELATVARLEVLGVDGDSRTVRTVFASSYRALHPGAALMFRMVGVHPGTTFSAHLGAAMLGRPSPDGARACDDLAANHLLAPAGPDRYRAHDLIRLYANECAQVELDARSRHDAASRMLDWYLAVAVAANQVLDPLRDRVVPHLVDPPATLPFAPQAPPVLDFLDGERPNLAPVVEFAATTAGFETVAWQLTYLLTGYFDARGHWSDRVELCGWGLRAATRQGEPLARGLMHSALGVAYLTTGRYVDALAHLNPGLHLMRSCGDQRGEGHVLNNIAAVYTGQRRYAEAVDAFGRALALHTAKRHPMGMALALNNMGYVCALMGDTDVALARLDEALRISRELGHDRLEAVVLHSQGQAYAHRADRAAAEHRFARALDIRRRLGERRLEADTLTELGRLRLRADPLGTLATMAEVLEISHELADDNLESLARNVIGAAHLELGQPVPARAQLEAALALRIRIPDQPAEQDVRHNLARLAAAGR